MTPDFGVLVTSWSIRLLRFICDNLYNSYNDLIFFGKLESLSAFRISPFIFPTYVHFFDFVIISSFDQFFKNGLLCVLVISIQTAENAVRSIYLFDIE